MSESSCGAVLNRSRLHPAIRAAVALACGSVVGALAFTSAWKNSAGNSILYANHRRAADDMLQFDDAIAAYQQQNDALPQDLSQLEFPEDWELRRDSEGAMLDPWGHPYVYRVIGDRYQLSSHGRDGTTGGIGLDADLPSEPRSLRSGQATLRQFLFEMETADIRQACLLSAICTAIACWYLMTRTAGDPILFRIVAWGLTLGFAWFVAQFMSVLHIPSGH